MRWSLTAEIFWIGREFPVFFPDAGNSASQLLPEDALVDTETQRQNQVAFPAVGADEVQDKGSADPAKPPLIIRGGERARIR
jgi:hypothetical protein